MRFRAAPALALLTAACTPMAWVKPDATPQELAQDSAYCQQEAWREARLRSWSYRPMGPLVAHDAAGRPFIVSPGGPFYDPFGDPMMEEGRLAQFCMRARGYELVPADKIQPSPSGTPPGTPKPG
ncbi:MAG TPA: hypothetical protein VFB08_15310 [Burkholderiales bacterium]|nr:hypothetical protein [Burkholderiales bacterium]